ncbi:hypothetical protein QTG54_006095 [Skeletonema marinoi]|uniref:Uncharacterized protein n=1 Tax=Skeletonema marinoi TaxID=267567 RepID=A0AAD9DER3_9STRA|nr:hypothetical protein QTG54_006095 [Skeletonema marinoi]
MSDAADSKSSSGSETNSSAKAREDSLDLMQRMIVDQQQHLISHYQYKKSKNISGEIEGKGRDDLTPRIEREKSELRVINQQHSILKSIEKDNYTTSNGVDSEKAVPSKEESPDSQQDSRALKDKPSLAHEMTLSSSREIPKQKHLEDALIGREISCRGGKSSQEQGQSESRPSAALSEMEVAATLAIPYSSENAWRKLELELAEYFSIVEINDESTSHKATPAELKSPPDTFNGDSTAADSTYERLWQGSYPGQVQLPVQSRSLALPQRLGRDHDDEDDINDRKPTANNPDDDVV